MPLTSEAPGGASSTTLSLRHYGASHGSHTHEHFQMLVGLDGVLELEVAGRGQRIGVGDACLVAPGQRHDFESAVGASCLVLDSAHPGWQRCAALPAHPQQTHALAQYLASALQQAQPLATQHAPWLLLECWSPAADTPRPHRRIDWPALAAWAQARLAQPLCVADLAQQCTLSVSQFAQRCQDAQGQSPMQWLRQQRLAQAHALRAAGLPVAETARRTGYRSPSALTAAMRRAGRSI